MRTGQPKTPIMLSPEDQSQLNTIANSRSLPHGIVSRAKIILMAAEGQTNQGHRERGFPKQADGLQVAAAVYRARHFRSPR